MAGLVLSVNQLNEAMDAEPGKYLLPEPHEINTSRMPVLSTACCSRQVILE